MGVPEGEIIGDTDRLQFANAASEQSGVTSRCTPKRFNPARTPGHCRPPQILQLRVSQDVQLLLVPP
jgi:hypothetical protein